MAAKPTTLTRCRYPTTCNSLRRGKRCFLGSNANLAPHVVVVKRARKPLISGLRSYSEIALAHNEHCAYSPYINHGGLNDTSLQRSKPRI